MEKVIYSLYYLEVELHRELCMQPVKGSKAERAKGEIKQKQSHKLSTDFLYYLWYVCGMYRRMHTELCTGHVHCTVAYIWLASN